MKPEWMKEKYVASNPHNAAVEGHIVAALRQAEREVTAIPIYGCIRALETKLKEDVHLSITL